jgi:hypothetical protein
MATVKDDIEQYQWIKGDDFGKIVEVESTDSQFINFTNGTKIFKALSTEFLKIVKDGVIPLPGADKVNERLNNKNKELLETNLSVNNSKKEETNTKEPSIMGKMITKMSKKNVVNLPIQINLNIPTPALYSILAGGMEDEDLNDEIMEVALDQIKLDKLQSYIKENISDFLSDYYA